MTDSSPNATTVATEIGTAMAAEIGKEIGNAGTAAETETEGPQNSMATMMT